MNEESPNVAVLDAVIAYQTHLILWEAVRRGIDFETLFPASSLAAVVEVNTAVLKQLLK